jgi:hypothetical protein
VIAVCALALAEPAAAQDAPGAVARDTELWEPGEALQAERPVPDEPPETSRVEPPGEPAPPETSSADDQVLPLPEPDSQAAADDQRLPEPAATSATSESPAQDLPSPDGQLGSSDASAAAIGNEDVRAMATAQFSETTMLAAIAANPTSFDVSPRALVSLKGAGVPERVIEAMIAAESSKKQPSPTATEAPLVDGAANAGATTSALAVAAPSASAPATPAPAAAMSTEEFTKLSAMIEQLAAQQEAAVAARREPEAPRSADPSPHAWIVQETDKTALAPTIAQVAFTDERGAATFKTLHGLANKALAFANPAVSGIATTLGGLFRPNDPDQTAVWALAGGSAVRELGSAAVFEVEYGNIPGVDPDKYRPAIVRLVRTNDNYRLVAAAKTEGASKTVPSGPIIEENVATELTQLGRGRYRAASREKLGAGEYALVLRPIAQKERAKRKSSEASLGELLGGGTTQILYFTWDFTVASL